MGSVEWPAAILYPLPLLKVARIKRQTETVPMVGGASEQAKTCGYERIIVMPRDLAGAKRLRLPVVLQTAALKEDHPKRAIDTFSGQSNTGRARPHDAKICLKRLVPVDGPCIHKHKLSSNRRTNEDLTQQSGLGKLANGASFHKRRIAFRWLFYNFSCGRSHFPE